MTTGAIIQARVGSTRLPGKVLLKVLNKTILEYVVERVKRAELVDTVIVATSLKKEDLEIELLAKSLDVHIYRGSEHDVLDRFYEAAKAYNVSNIVRITADCPLIDPEVIDKAIKHYLFSGADYCSNTIERTFPDGEDVEVFSFNALQRAWKEAVLQSEREHVGPYIWKNTDRFKLTCFKNNEDLSSMRWTLDREEDFSLLRLVIEGLYPVKPDFSMKDVVEFFRNNPCLENVNKGISKSEGYLKSLKEDKVMTKGSSKAE